jgi:S1-C subfamily serine protease
MTTLRILAATLVLVAAAAWARADSEEKARIDLIRRVSNSVVRISVSGTAEQKTKDGKVFTESAGGGGTGFIIVHDEHPYIVTNHHDVAAGRGITWKGKPRIVVGFNSQLERQEVTVVGTDQLSDLAVLKFPDGSGEEKTVRALALEFAKPESIEVGQTVLAVGYPRSQPGGPSIARGIISALGRSLAEFGDLLQIDAATNPGNSGGPLVNLRGEVLGVNTFGYGTRVQRIKIRVPNLVQQDGSLKLQGYTDYEPLASFDATTGMNYARSASSAAPIVRLLIKNGKIERPNLGFRFETLFWANAAVFDLPEGVLVTAVDKDGPSARATISLVRGLSLTAEERSLKGCLITGVRWEKGQAKGQTMVKSQGDLFLALALVPPGSKLILEAEKLNAKRQAIIDTAIAKGWLAGNREAAPNVQDFLKLGSEGLVDKKVQIEYTLPPR